MGKRKMNDKRWMLEFSKKMLVMLSICYGATLIFTATVMVVFQDISGLPTFLEQVTMVFSLGVVSYLIKSAVENVFKINDNKRRTQLPPEDDGESSNE